MTQLELDILKAKNACFKMLQQPKYWQHQFDFHLNKLKKLQKLQAYATAELSDFEVDKQMGRVPQKQEV